MHDSYPIFPFYLVIDVSASMSGCLDAINAELPVLKSEIESDPIVGEIARFSIITFSDKADQVLPLSDLLDVETMPTLHAQGPTRYGKAFSYLRGCINHDVAWYKQEGLKLYRPAVFFITDGQPTDKNWEPEYQQLIARDTASYWPNIVSFGFGQADHLTLSYVATYKAFAAVEGQNPSQVLRTIGQELTKSIISSSEESAGGHAVLRLPDTIDGMQQLPVDLL